MENIRKSSIPSTFILPIVKTFTNHPNHLQNPQYPLLLLVLEHACCLSLLSRPRPLLYSMYLCDNNFIIPPINHLCWKPTLPRNHQSAFDNRKSTNVVLVVLPKTAPRRLKCNIFFPCCHNTTYKHAEVALIPSKSGRLLPPSSAIRQS